MGRNNDRINSACSQSQQTEPDRMCRYHSKILFVRDLARLLKTIQRCGNHSVSVTIRLNGIECAAFICGLCLIDTRMMTDLETVIHFYKPYTNIIGCVRECFYDYSFFCYLWSKQQLLLLPHFLLNIIIKCSYS